MPRKGRPPKEPDTATYAGRFAARLRVLRERKGWTVEELRDRLGEAGLTASEATVRRWERGDGLPSIADLPAFAAAFEVRPRTVLPQD